MRTCTDRASAPTITWRLQNYHLGRALIITVIDGRWHWQLDEPNARPSSGHRDYPRCLASARLALGLPAIAESGRHLTAADATTE